jgi:GNAT superfamily N-acetyltransferase
MEGVVVRAAEDRDAVGIAALHLQHERELGAAVRPGFLDEVADAWLRGRAHRRTWIAEQDDGRPVGVVHGEVVEELPRLRPTSRRWMHLSLVFVSTDCRGAGLGDRLVREAVAWATRERLARVDLTTASAARSLYERLGFVPAEGAMTLLLRDGERRGRA